MKLNKSVLANKKTKKEVPKDAWEAKKLASCKIPREINTLKNWTQHLPFGKKILDYTKSYYNKFDKIFDGVEGSSVPVKKREISFPLTSYFALIGKGCHFNCHATTCEQTCVLGGCSLVCHGKYCNQACQGGYCKLECPSDTKECKQSCGPGQPCSKVIAKLPTPTPYSPAECSSVVNGVCKQFCSTDSCDMKCFNSPYYHSCELSCTDMYLITFIYYKFVYRRTSLGEGGQ